MPDLATLFIKVDSKGVVTASKDLNKLTDDSKKTEKATDGVTSSFSKQIAIVKALAVAYGALKIVQYIKDATMLAARYETLGVVMRVVGNNAGFTGKQMEGYAKGLQKAGIAMIESRNTLARMVQAQIDLNKSSELARIAQDAAVIGNLNSSESFERLINGIQRGMPILLKTIGINVQFEKGYIKLAKSLGISSNSLTDLQKVQSRTNTVIKAGTLIAGAYEGAMDTAGKQVLSLKRHTDNLKVGFGEAFTPALAEIVSQITGNIKGLNKDLAENQDAIKDWGNNFRLTILSIEAEIMRLAMFIDQVGGTLSSIGLFLTGPGALLGMIPGLEGLAIPFERLADLNILLEDRHNATGKSLEALAVRYEELLAAMSPAGKAAKKLAEEALEKTRMDAAALSERLKAEADAAAATKAVAKKAADEKAALQSDFTDWYMKSIKTEEEFAIFSLDKQLEKFKEFSKEKLEIIRAQELENIAERFKVDPVDPVDPFDLVDQLAERASYYQNLIGFEDTYHEKMLELIKVRRQAEIDSGEDVAAATAKSLQARNALAEEMFDNEINHIQKQWTGYSDMFQGLGQLYDKDSGQRKTLHQISMAFQVAEQAMMLVTAVRAAVIAIANQGQGDPYTAFARVAAMTGVMAATLASAGIGLGGGGGGGGASASRPASTVLGAEAGTGSESIAKGWELLEDTYDMQFRELSGIHSEMKNLNSNITGLVTSIFRTGGLGVSGIKTGETIGIAQKIAGAAGIGGLLTNMVSNLVGSIFGGATRTKITGSGISTGAATLGSLAEGGGIGGREFARVKTSTKGGLFSSSTTKFSTVYAALDEDVSRLLDLVFQNMSNTLIELTTGLGADMDATLNFVFSGAKINLKGMDTDEINKTLTEHFSAIGDNAVDALFGSILRPYQQLGEGLLETATRILIDKAVVLDALDLTGQAFSGTIPQIIAFSEAIIGMAGDLETLHQNAETFFNKFFSDEEKQLRLQEQLTKALGDLNLTLPTARDGYRDLVEGLDLTTASGQRAFVSLLALSGAADDYYSTIEDIQSESNKNALALQAENDRQVLAIQAARFSLELQLLNALGRSEDAIALKRQSELDAMDETLHALQKQIWAQEDLNSDQAEADRVKAARFALELDLLNALGRSEEAVHLMRQSELDAMDETLHALQNQVWAQEDLNKALSDATDIARTAVDAQISEARTSASTARQAAESYKTVTDSLQSAIDEIRGIPGTSGAGFKSLFTTALTGDIEALAALPEAAKSFLSAAISSSSSAVEFRRAEGEILNMLNEALLVSVAETDWNEYQATLLESQLVILEGIKDALQSPLNMATVSALAASAEASRPQFHAGGIAAGPGSGYAATLHGTELVVSPNASFPATVRGGDSPGDRKLLERIATAIESGNFQIAKNTGKTARVLTRFDYDGMPPERTQ